MVTLQASTLQDDHTNVNKYSEKSAKTDLETDYQISEIAYGLEDITNNNKNLVEAINDLDNCSIVHCDSLIHDEDTIVSIDDDPEEGNELEETEWMPDTIQTDEIQLETSNGQVLPSLDKTTFGEVHITRSQNVRVGNTTLYKGPVTIKQFVYSNAQPSKPLDIDDKINHDLGVEKVDSDTTKFSNNSEYNKMKKWLWTWKCAAVACILALTILLAVVVVSITQKSEKNLLASLGIAIDPDDILTENVRFVDRVDWGAQPAEETPEPLEITPAPYVIVSHTASEGCNKQSECVKRVRLAQTMHIEGNKWSDIAYNFLVGGDGLVYVGRGWGITGAHAFGYNSKSIGISFIGTFNKQVPPQRQLHAFKKLVEIGVKKNAIAKDYKLLGHRQISETLSPGDILYSIIQKDDHWSPKP